VLACRHHCCTVHGQAGRWTRDALADAHRGLHVFVWLLSGHGVFADAPSHVVVAVH